MGLGGEQWQFDTVQATVEPRQELPFLKKNALAQ
jgi:hypothetical protein